MKGLALELSAQIASMNITTPSTLLGHRGHSGVALETGGRVKAVALRAQAGQQSRREHRSGAGQTGEDGTIGMLGKSGGDLFVISLDGLAGKLELLADQLHAQDEAGDERGFVGGRHGFLDQVQTLFLQRDTAGAMPVVELLQLGRAGLLDRLKTGPTEQEVRSQWPPEVLPAQEQGLGEVLFLVLCFRPPAGLTRRRQYRRVVLLETATPSGGVVRGPSPPGGSVNKVTVVGATGRSQTWPAEAGSWRDAYTNGHKSAIEITRARGRADEVIP